MEKWKKLVYISWLALFLHMTGMAMIMPFLPLYIKELGVTNPKEVTAWSGIIFGIAFLFSGILSPFWGSLGDKYGRKPIILRSSFGLSLVAIGMHLASNIYHLLILRIIHGVLGGIVPSFIALVSSNLPKDKTGTGLGTLQTAMIGGSILGPLIGGILSDLIGYRNVLLVIALLPFLGGIITTLFINEQRQEIKKTHFSVLNNIKFVVSSKYLIIIIIIQFTIQFSLMMVQPLLPLFIESLHVKTNIGTFVGATFATTGIFTMIFAPLFGKEGDKKGHRKILSRSLLFTSIFFFPQSLVTSIYQLLPLRAAIGTFVAGIVPSTQSLIVKNTPDSKRGGILGITQSFSLFGNAIGPIIGGSLAAIFGIRLSFIITSIILFFTWNLSKKLTIKPAIPSPPTEQ